MTRCTAQVARESSVPRSKNDAYDMKQGKARAEMSLPAASWAASLAFFFIFPVMFVGSVCGIL